MNTNTEMRSYWNVPDSVDVWLPKRIQYIGVDEHLNPFRGLQFVPYLDE